jgi:hypothetical protein
MFDVYSFVCFSHIQDPSFTDFRKFISDSLGNRIGLLKMVWPKFHSEFLNNFNGLPNRKIVIIDLFSNNTESFDPIIADLSSAELIICLTHEIIDLDNRQKYKDHLKNKNIVFISAGFTNVADINDVFSSDDVLYFPYWFSEIYYNNTRKIDNTLSKPFKYDALLGSMKKHRIDIFNVLQKTDLLEQSLVNLKYSPWHATNGVAEYISSALAELEDNDINNFKNNGYTHSGDKLSSGIRMSCKISSAIYVNSHYSLISETGYKDNEYFLTEKTAKAIFLDRVFILCSGKHQLKFLQKLGFKTFHGLIDEQYDELSWGQDKIDAITSQLIWLAKQNPTEIYQLASDTLSHNRLRMDTLVECFTDTFNDFIKKHVDRLV